MTAFVPITDLLLLARHSQMMDIYHRDGSDESVQVLEILTDVLERNYKLEPDDHVGKKVIIIDPYFDEYIPATITWQDIGVYDEGYKPTQFTLYFNGEESGGFTRDQFKFVGGD